VPPKTGGSVRRIPIGSILSDILKRHYRESGKPVAGAYVFSKEDGAPLHPEVVRKDVLYPILDRLGIKRMPRESGFHRFRYSAGSFVNAETGDLKLAQSLLGHTQLSTTANIYTHMLPSAEKNFAGIGEGNFRKSVPSLFPIGNRNRIFGAKAYRIKTSGGFTAPCVY
jgi:integrase